MKTPEQILKELTLYDPEDSIGKLIIACLEKQREEFKEYLFNTANYSGKQRNITRQYLTQTINFLNQKS